MAKSHRFGLDVKVYKDGARYTSTVCVKDRNPSEDGNKRCGVELGAPSMKAAVASAMRDLADTLAPGAGRSASSRGKAAHAPARLVAGRGSVKLSAQEVKHLLDIAADAEENWERDDPAKAKVARKLVLSLSGK